MPSFIHKAKNFWGSRTRRERFMFAALMLAAALIWLANLSSASGEVDEAILEAGSRLSAARLAVSQEGEVSQKLEAAQNSVDASQSISIRDLQNLVEDCAKRSYLQYETSLPSASENIKSGKISASVLRFSAPHATLGGIIMFEKNLKELEPYAVVKEASLVSDGKGRVNARYKIYSFNFSQQK